MLIKYYNVNQIVSITICEESAERDMVFMEERVSRWLRIKKRAGFYSFGDRFEYLPDDLPDAYYYNPGLNEVWRKPYVHIKYADGTYRYEYFDNAVQVHRFRRDLMEQINTIWTMHPDE